MPTRGRRGDFLVINIITTTMQELAGVGHCLGVQDCANRCMCITSFNPQNKYVRSTKLIKMRKMRPRKFKKITYNHIVNEKQG